MFQGCQSRMELLIAVAEIKIFGCYIFLILKHNKPGIFLKLIFKDKLFME